jgi:hypothetical protein
MHLIRAILPAAFVLLAAPSVHAEETNADKLACVSALDNAQSLQTARKMKDARASFVACSAEACPAVVREDCAKSLMDLDATMPSIVLSATVDGHDAADARVTLDGTPMDGALDGRSLAVDPGAHVARFERDGSAPVEVKIIAREGEKNRVVSASFVIQRASATPAKPIAAEGRASIPVLPLVLGGIGISALAGGAFMRLSADADARTLQGTCAPKCDPSERDALSNRLVISNVALGVGAVALTASAVTWLLARK